MQTKMRIGGILPPVLFYEKELESAISNRVSECDYRTGIKQGDYKIGEDFIGNEKHHQNIPGRQSA